MTEYLTHLYLWVYECRGLAVWSWNTGTQNEHARKLGPIALKIQRWTACQPQKARFPGRD
jgi:hypothetical protein